MEQEQDIEANEGGVHMGRYRLGREIGRGFSSIVYEALDVHSGRTVALKVLTFSPHLGPDRRRDLTQRFAREARAISALAHPAIVAIYGFGQTDDGRWFTAMERLEGESLRSRLQRGGEVPSEEAIPIAVQIADALEYAHGCGIVHRDVKPDNIFLLPDGRAKLMDFGVAHVLSEQAITQTGTIVGSPAYMSPEQINGQPLDGRSDVFSLGVTLAEMLAGHKPFDAPTVPAVMHRILNRAPQLSAVSPWALRRLVAKALAKNRAARYGSAAALADALRRQGGPHMVIWDSTSSLIPQGVPLPAVYRSAPSSTPVRSVPARRPVPPLAWAAAALAIIAMSAWPILASHKRPAAVQVPAGQIRTIPLVWRRVSSRPRPAAGPLLATPPHKSAVRIVEAITGGAPPLPARPARPLPPAAPRSPATPSAPVRTQRSPSGGRPGAKIAQAPVRRPSLPPPSTALRQPIIRIAGDRQEQQDLTPPVPDSLPSVAATDTDQEALEPPRDIPAAPPHLAHRVQPVYPVAARDAGLEGTVTLRVSVDEDGAVSGIEITESSGVRALDQAALQAVRRWEYDPAFRNGAPIPGATIERIVFSLD